MGKEVRTYVELFAGCGGMSLGIESEGFRRLFANELSPMPAATYAFNLIHKKQPQSQNVEEWYTRLYGDGKTQSFYPNPDNYLADGVTDYALDKLGQLKGDMFVGGINQLNAALHKIPRETIEKIDVDILSGGPPCQSFSMAGRRDKNNVRNTLPFEFANSAQVLRPKVVLMENVSGILRPFRDEQGDEWFAWFEVAKTFFEKGYVPICVNVAASSFGVPQRRPRFLMIGVRRDIANKAVDILGHLSEPLRLKWQKTRDSLVQAMGLYDTVDMKTLMPQKRKQWIEPGDSWPDGLLPMVEEEIICVEEAISDLTDYEAGVESTNYNKMLSEAFDSLLPPYFSRDIDEDEEKNREERKHSPVVRSRFRLLRLLAARNDKPINIGSLQSLTVEDEEWLLKQKLLFPAGEKAEERNPENITELRGLLMKVKSKKLSQRALIASRVAPAQLSIPDDLVHYAQDRTLTVREMARIQSFPDWFEFKGKVTTGGKMRAFEVPRYTQVGNAVPPLMAKRVAMGIRNFLDIVGE